MSATLSYFERLALGHYQLRKNPGKFDKEQLRIREIHKIVQGRHGGKIPETDDASIYFAVMAKTHTATFARPEDQKSALAEWITSVASWANAQKVAHGLIIDDPNHRFRSHFTARQLGLELRLTYEERVRFGIRTIACFDKTPEEMEALRRERDRHRKADRRAEAGSRPQSQSKSRTRPWIDAGFNTRRTWEKWLKRQRVADLGYSESEPFADLARLPENEFANSARPLEIAHGANSARPAIDPFANSSGVKTLNEDLYVSRGGKDPDEIANRLPAPLVPWREADEKERAGRRQRALAWLHHNGAYEPEAIPALVDRFVMSLTAAAQVVLVAKQEAAA